MLNVVSVISDAVTPTERHVLLPSWETLALLHREAAGLKGGSDGLCTYL